MPTTELTTARINTIKQEAKQEIKDFFIERGDNPADYDIDAIADEVAEWYADNSQEGDQNDQYKRKVQLEKDFPTEIVRWIDLPGENEPERDYDGTVKPRKGIILGDPDAIVDTDFATMVFNHMILK